MKKVIITVGALLHITTAYANLIPNLADDAAKRFMHSDATAECTNFSGNWKGKCTGMEAESKLSVMQFGCDVVSLGSQLYFIGGVAQHGYVIPNTGENKTGYVNSDVVVHWNGDKSALNASASSTFYRLGETKTYAGAAKGEIKFVGPQLVSQFTIGDKTYSCVYDKE